VEREWRASRVSSITPSHQNAFGASKEEGEGGTAAGTNQSELTSMKRFEEKEGKSGIIIGQRKQEDNPLVIAVKGRQIKKAQTRQDKPIV